MNIGMKKKNEKDRLYKDGRKKKRMIKGIQGQKNE